jgi:hypothetical protein
MSRPLRPHGSICVLCGFLRFLRFAFAWLAANIHGACGIGKRKPQKSAKHAKNSARDPMARAMADIPAAIAPDGHREPHR